MQAIIATSSSHSSLEAGQSGEQCFVDLLAAELIKIGSEKGPSLCRYEDHSSNTNKARLVLSDINGVESCYELLGRIQKIMPQLVITKTCLKDALFLTQENLAKKRPEFWKMDGEELDDWCETLQRRIRNCLRVVRQGIQRSPAEKWVVGLPWIGASAAQKKRAKDPETVVAEQPTKKRKKMKKKTPVVEKKKTPVVDYTYGFLQKNMLPFRQKVGSKFKETGLPVVVDEDESDSDDIFAEWPDGSRHTVPFKVGQWRKMQQGSLKQGGSDLWTGTVKASGHALNLRQKVDRDLLLALNEQGK